MVFWSWKPRISWKEHEATVDLSGGRQSHTEIMSAKEDTPSKKGGEMLWSLFLLLHNFLSQSLISWAQSEVSHPGAWTAKEGEKNLSENWLRTTINTQQQELKVCYCWKPLTFRVIKLQQKLADMYLPILSKINKQEEKFNQESKVK